MGNQISAFLRVIGLLMQVPGAMALASVAICLIFREYYAIFPFLFTAAFSIGVGQFLYRRFHYQETLRYRHTLIVVALCWLIVFVIGAIPYWMIASYLANIPGTSETTLAFQNIWNALFESVSGFTATGLTMAKKGSQLPHCLQWWRSLTQWVGGIGLVVITLSLLQPIINVQQLYSAEARDEKIAPTFKATAQEIWKIYSLYTAIGILLMLFAGVPLWQAINHTLSGISTGGFTITDDSMQSYGLAAKGAAIAIMIGSATSFKSDSQAIRQRRLSVFWQDNRHQALWLILTGSAVLLLLEQYWASGNWVGIDSLFQAVSTLATVGFNTVKVENWSPVSRLIMIVTMTFGVVSGSAGGGLKLDRIVVLFKSVTWHLRSIYQESPEDLRYELDGRKLTPKDAHQQLNSAIVIALLWAVAQAVGTFVLFHITNAKYSLLNVLFECTSAMSTTGISIGITSPDLAWSGKLTLMLLMWMGRLEIVAVLVLFAWILQPLIPNGRGKIEPN